MLQYHGLIPMTVDESETMSISPGNGRSTGKSWESSKIETVALR